MFRTLCLLALVAFCVRMVHSWDLAVSHGDVLDFYVDTAKTETVRLDSHKLAALAYDEVHDMLLYVDKQADNDIICGYGISSRQSQCFMERKGRNIRGIAFDPVTEILFFSDTNERSINWISVKSESKEYGNLLIKIDDGIPTDIAVDGCRGYVYWINTNLTKPRIERAQFNGFEKEFVIDINSLSLNTTYIQEPHSLTIDQQTNKMYWIEPKDNINQDNVDEYNIYYIDLSEKGKTKLIGLYRGPTYKNLPNPSSNTLTVATTSIYWVDWRFHVSPSVFKFTKIVYGNLQEIKLGTKNFVIGIAANYKVKDLIQGNNDCKAHTFIRPKNCEGTFCVHGVKVGQSLCNCTPGYIGERCDVSVCELYCLHGNCSVDDKGIPSCRCDTGFSGERCEVAACQNYCLNKGVCTLNEEDEPSCECVDKYEGSRCEAFQAVTLTFSNAPAYSEETNKTFADLLSNWRKPKILVIVDES